MYNNKAYIIKTKTNLHVGSDGTNFGIVDKQVQRDSITNLPVINSSSLKGAIKYHFEDILNSEETSKHFIKLFGDDSSGLVKFIDAKLLFLPLRSNKKPFYHTTSISNLKAMVEFLASFGIDIKLDHIDTNKSVVIGKQSATVEDVDCQALDINIPAINETFGIQNLAIFTDEDFNEVVENLPVIARNKIATNENKTDGNLWYEEVVPRESIFFTVLCYSNNFNTQGADSRGKTDKTIFDAQYKKFEQKLINDTIQIGANTSIGYGICDFILLGESDE